MTKWIDLLLVKMIMVKVTANIIPKIRTTLEKRWHLYAIVFCLCFLAFFPAKAQKGSTISTVVIDAGHGGKDPGAVGKHSREKHIALSVALKLGQYIEDNYKDVKVVYTRKTDHFVELHKRAEIANKNNADLFISIHCNSNPSSKPYGSETYVMGLHKSNANLNVAMKENAAIMFEEDAEKVYEGFDANSPESYIQFSLFQDTYLDQSTNLATKIQKQFKERVGRKDRGVYQAGFLVLWRTAMPGMLVELGFLSNPTEEKFLLSDKGQTYMASAIYRAFKEYKYEFERENAVSAEVSKPIKKVVDPIVEQEKTDQVHNDLVYRVQLYTNKTKIPLNDKLFSNLEHVFVYEHNGLFKYTAGQFFKLAEAQQYLKTVQKKGHRDAFVVPFFKDKRISSTEASRLEKGS